MAILIARDIGLDRLCQPDGLEFLLERIKQHVFPLQSQDASELFRVGQLRTGPLSRQQGESMLSYVSRRKRWWVTLQELDGEIKLCEAMRANLLVELSGLQRSEQLMVKTAAKKETVDEHARVLIQHRAQVCMREGLLTEPPSNTLSPGPTPLRDAKAREKASTPTRDGTETTRHSNT